MPFIFSTWDTLVTDTLYPSSVNLLALTDQSIQVLIYKSKIEVERSRTYFIVSIIDKVEVKDKEEFVKINQALLISLLDKLYSYYDQIGENQRISNLYDIIIKHLQTSLDFLQYFFSNYFDKTQNVPRSYLVSSIKGLCEELEKLHELVRVGKNMEQDLVYSFINNFDRFCVKGSEVLTYDELEYQIDLMNALLNDGVLNSELSIREVLFYFNFNDDNYIEFIVQKLKTITTSLTSRKEIIALLRFEQKNMNQLRTRSRVHLVYGMPSLKEQINHWINEEVKFLEMEPVSDSPSNISIHKDEKIQTSLSVAKLALIIRLMVVDKIIVNRVIAQVLRIVIRTVATLQKETVAFGSLETKYHNPDKGTISAVKEILFRWISILNKL